MLHVTMDGNIMLPPYMISLNVGKSTSKASIISSRSWESGIGSFCFIIYTNNFDYIGDSQAISKQTNKQTKFEVGGYLRIEDQERGESIAAPFYLRTKRVKIHANLSIAPKFPLVRPVQSYDMWVECVCTCVCTCMVCMSICMYMCIMYIYVCIYT